MNKRLIGTILSDKMEKTRSVGVASLKKHPLYGKPVKSMKRYLVHDESNESKMGDVVEIEETRPLSRHKSWKIIEVKERSTGTQ